MGRWESAEFLNASKTRPKHQTDARHKACARKQLEQDRINQYKRLRQSIKANAFNPTNRDHNVAPKKNTIYPIKLSSKSSTKHTHTHTQTPTHCRLVLPALRQRQVRLLAPAPAPQPRGHKLHLERVGSRRGNSGNVGCDHVLSSFVFCFLLGGREPLLDCLFDGKAKKVTPRF